MRVLFAGTPEPALPTLRALLDAGHEVVAVASNPDAPSGRGKQLSASPVAAAAQALGLQLLQPVKAREPWFVDAVKDLAPDVAVIVAWGCLIPDSLLGVPTHGWVNVHFSLLPAWRGAAPVQRAIMAGEKVSGVTTFELVHDLDAGPVYRQMPVEISDGETAGELLGRLALVGAETLVGTLDDIANGVQPMPQPSNGVSLAPKVTTDDARIDWQHSASAVEALVRGVTPHPGAWTMLEGARFKVGQVELIDGAEPALVAGEMSATKKDLLVGTGDGVLRLVTVQAVGKPVMEGAAWARGARLEPGAHFE